MVVSQARVWVCCSGGEQEMEERAGSSEPSCLNRFGAAYNCRHSKLNISMLTFLYEGRMKV